MCDHKIMALPGLFYVASANLFLITNKLFLMKNDILRLFLRGHF